jgi:hypothetical protein
LREPDGFETRGGEARGARREEGGGMSEGKGEGREMRGETREMRGDEGRGVR